ncbi:MAG: lipopolysaccharide biosynthesis protein [Verrucomicrobiia bacterium]
MNRREFSLPLVSRVVAAVSALASGLICLRLYRRLELEDFGVVMAALQILNYLPLLDGGFRLTVNRLILAEGDADGRRPLAQFYQKLHLGLAGLGFVVAQVCMVVYWAIPVARESGQPLIFFVTLGVVGALTVGSGIQAGLLIGLRAQEQTYLLTAVNAWLNAGVLWLALRAGLDVWSFPLSMLATLLMTYVLAVLLIRRRAPGWKFLDWQWNARFWDLFRELRGSAWTCFRSQVVTVLLYTIDLVFVLYLCGPKDAAVYAVLSRIFAMMRTFLQSSGEVSWPLIAQRGMGNEGFRQVLIRSNAWIYGAVTGAACVSLLPFCSWYLGDEWVASPLVLYLVAARFVITGLATPTAYILYGLGEFHVLTRCLQAELIVSCVLALVLGAVAELPGVALAFLLATSVGTLYPMIAAYAKVAGVPPGQILVEMWWRTLAGFACSMVWAWYLLRFFPDGPATVIPAAVGLISGLMLPLVISVLRAPKPASLLHSPGGLAHLLKGI